jgi:uncharacterized protein (DUF1778 family)
VRQFAVRLSGEEAIKMNAKQERLEARIAPEQKRLIEHAAGLKGMTVTAFVVASAQQAAIDAVKDFEMLSLRDEAREVFINALLHPPAPNEAARAAARRFKQQSER